MRRIRRAHQRHAGINKRFRRRMIAAGTAAAISLTAGTSLAKSPVPVGDRHQMVATQDADRDFLADREEIAIGYQPYKADQNRNTFQDGVELAVCCADAIAQLPLRTEATDPTQTYKEEIPQFGVELCDVCGEAINMGTVRVVNPRLGLDVELPIIAQHYMEHGAFSYAGEVHKGRVNVPVLLRAMDIRFPYEANEHQLPLDISIGAAGQIAPDANDVDGDLLADSEELVADLNLHDADQNENLLPDGIELAQRCAEIIDRLPTFDQGSTDAKGIYRTDYMLRGLEWCGICGESVNMGYWQVVNSALGRSIEVSVIAWHFMQHGSFSYTGDVHGAHRIDVAALLEILGLPARCSDPGALRLPADLNEDGAVNFKDIAELAQWWLDSTDPIQDQPSQK